MTLDLSKVTLPFSAGDMLAAGMSLLGLVAAFVLLSMAFDVVPKFVALIRNAFSRGGRRA
ncbi:MULTISPECIES: hypothetical protein [unclassified Lysinibacillus]|uniref:hypothetical protein n=1 Tax=unclassified Lysinibacillus TaxID=2636778 RepID=UPI00201B3F29|nr:MULTISPECIES: hypothetical protein [unclassified Lysinibacillus]